MPRLLIQCQGSPGPLSFNMSPAHADCILRQYRRVPRHQVPAEKVISITVNDNMTYHINLALVPWIHVTDEDKNKPDESDYTSSGPELSQRTLDIIDSVIRDVRELFIGAMSLSPGPIMNTLLSSEST